MALSKVISIIDHDIRAARMALTEDVAHVATTLQAQITVLIAQIAELRADVDKLMGR
jgi:hypothetical protein